MELNLQQIDLETLLPFTGIVAIGFLVGLVLDLIIKKKISNFILKTTSQYDDQLLQAIGMSPLYLSVIVSGYIGSFVANITGETRERIKFAVLTFCIIIFTVVIARVVGVLVKYYFNRTRGGGGAASLYSNGAKIIIYVLGLLIGFQTAGVNITALLTALGVGGLAVALALQDTLANLFAGFYIIAAHKIRTGDFIQLEGGQEGYVQDISWRNTTIRALPDHLIIVPNSTIGSATIRNYHLPEKEMSLIIDMGVGYGEDLEKVEKVVIDESRKILKEFKGGVPEVDPFIRFKEFGDSSINFSVILRISEFVDQYYIKHEFIKGIHKRFQKEKIEIPFPTMDINVKK